MCLVSTKLVSWLVFHHWMTMMTSRHHLGYHLTMMSCGYGYGYGCDCDYHSHYLTRLLVLPPSCDCDCHRQTRMMLASYLVTPPPPWTSHQETIPWVVASCQTNHLKTSPWEAVSCQTNHLKTIPLVASCQASHHLTTPWWVASPSQATNHPASNLGSLLGRKLATWLD